MIKLKELHLHNFRSWKELHLTDLDSKGLTLIQAENGFGKSSIRQAIEYLLTDTTADELPLEELPFNGDTECKIIGVLQRGGDLVEITKYRNSKKFKNQTILSVNGDESLTHTDRRETQKKIEELLNVDNLFISTIFSTYSSSFAEAKESERKDVLYKFMNLGKYEKRASKAKEKCDFIKSDIEKKEDKIENLNEAIENSKEKLVELRGLSSTFDKQKKVKIAEKLAEREQLIEKDYSDLEKKCLDLINKKEEVDLKKLQSIKDERNKLFEDKASIDTEIKLLTRQLEEAQNSICPIFNDECDRLISESSKVEKATGPRLSKLKKRSDGIKSKFKELDDEIDECTTKLDRNDKVDKEVEVYTEEIKEIKQHNKNLEWVKDTIDKRIKEISEEKNLYIDLIKKEEEDIEEKSTAIELLTKECQKLSEEWQYYVFWMKGYSKQGLPNLKIEGMLGELEDEINRYLCQISNVSVSLNSQSELKSGDKREKIEYKVNDPNTKVCDYKSYSGGEKQRVKVADMFAIHSLMGQFNFLILDEVLEMSLDKQGCDLIIDLLRIKAEEVDSIFVISHNSQISDRFSNVITIKKENGISYIFNQC